MAVETASRLLSLPAEILDMIIPLCIDPTDYSDSTDSTDDPYDPIDDLSEDQTSTEAIARKTFLSLRLCCRITKNFVETPELFKRFFPTEIDIESMVISEEGLHKLTGFKNLTSPNEWTRTVKTDGVEVVRRLLGGVKADSDAVRNITALQLHALPAVPVSEFDTDEWTVLLSRLVRFRVTIETLRKPAHPLRVVDGRALSEYDLQPSHNVNPFLLNDYEDDDIANTRFEGFRRQVLSWPEKLGNVEWLLLEFKYPERERRFRGFFAGGGRSMPKVSFLTIKGCVFGREFLRWLEGHKDVMTALWFNKVGPVEKVQGGQGEGEEEGEEGEEMGWEEVNSTLVKMHKLKLARAVEAYIDCKRHCQYTARGGAEVEEIVRRNDKGI